MRQSLAFTGGGCDCKQHFQYADACLKFCLFFTEFSGNFSQKSSKNPYLEVQSVYFNQKNSIISGRKIKIRKLSR